MTPQQREALRNVRDRIKEFSEECEQNEHTDVGEAWQILDEAYNAIDWLFTPTKDVDRRGCCADCGTETVEEAIGQVCGTCKRGIIEEVTP